MRTRLAKINSPRYTYSMTERLSNADLGVRLNVSHATVSRIRSGNRLPSIGVMSRISELTGWSIDDQVLARNENRYAEQFDLAFSAVEASS